MTRKFIATDSPGIRGRVNLKKINHWEQVNLEDIPKIVVDQLDLTKYILPQTDKELAQRWEKLKFCFLKSVGRHCHNKKVKATEDVFQDCYEQFNNLLAYYHPFYKTQILSDKEFMKNDKFRLDHYCNIKEEFTFYRTFELDQYLFYNMNFKIMDIVYRKYAKIDRKYLYPRTLVDESIIKKIIDNEVAVTKISNRKNPLNSAKLNLYDTLIEEIRIIILKDISLTEIQKAIATSYFVEGFSEDSIVEELQVNRKDIRDVIREIIRQTRRLKNFQDLKQEYKEMKKED